MYDPLLTGSVNFCSVQIKKHTHIWLSYCPCLCLIYPLVDENLRDEVEEYTKTRRGKELPGFVNYRTFENIVKKHIQELIEPAIQLLRDIKGKYQQL